MIDVSVVIVSWNTKEMLKNCLSSLDNIVDVKHVKIIVVDNASSDGSAHMVKSDYQHVKLINSGGNIGFGRANNLAANCVDTPYVLFLNPDTIVLKDSIRSMVDFLELNKSVGAIGCKMKSPDGTVHPLGLQWFPNPLTELINLLFISSETVGRLKKYLPLKDPNKSGYVKKLYGGCLMLRKSNLDQVGWFDERFFMYGEDVDLCRRISDSGWKLYYLSETVIIHLCAGASSEAGSNFSTLMKCESISKLIQKYNGNLGRILYIISIFWGANARLLILVFLKISSFLFSADRKFNYQSSFEKYITMIKWSLNLQKPFIKT
jgi:GT2 family glycosyltransferase